MNPVASATPAEMGTQRQMEIVDRLADNRLRAGDLQTLQDVGQTMTDTSICGLGQTASSAILTALDRFEFDETTGEFARF